MTSAWYTLINHEDPLGQGDIIVDCPLLTWAEGTEDPAERLENLETNEQGVLSDLILAEKLDVIVMTQACDLAQKKVSNVVLCPAITISEFRDSWESGERERGNQPSEKAWCRFFNNIRGGFIWNLALLNSTTLEGTSTEIRIVDFHEVFNLPLKFVEQVLRVRGGKRFRLAPPYREHLSQSFARYFMRVGLPVQIPKA